MTARGGAVTSWAGGPDTPLLLCAATLLLLGLVAISSASVEYADWHFGAPWYHTRRHVVYLLLGAALALLAYRVPAGLWQKSGWVALLVAFVLLILVLLPGIGHEVNGSQRWLPVGPLTLQPSEFAKLAMILYLAGYLVRREQEVQREWRGFLKPMGVVFTLTLLLAIEPDFGATVITVGTAFGMLFLAGVKLRHFLLVVCGSLAAMALLLASEPYRLQRLTAYRDPWADPYDSGFQLTQSLIAFGRGEWFGVGLGNSVQKLFYLPEAHTDFVFSIWAEETGVAGALLLLGLFALLVWRVLVLGRRLVSAGDAFGAQVCYGVALVFAGQVFVNTGVATGLLPTKGLTLPFFSYGGSSLITCLVMVAVVLRLARDGLPGKTRKVAR